jgi:hypothetical protein
MTTAKPPARYRAVEGALAGGSATAELHHPQGHDPFPRSERFPGEWRTAPNWRRMLLAASLCKGQLDLGGRFGAFVSGLEIPVPGGGAR